MSAEDDGFVARWSRRKVEARRGVEPATAAPVAPVVPTPVEPSAPLAPLPPAAMAAPVVGPAPAAAEAPAANAANPASGDPPHSAAKHSAAADVQLVAAAPLSPATPAPAPLTLDDVATLTRDSDYTRFVARDVTPGVRNAAMKKLFSDPHFNVMDGLDTYIDDYGKPDPIPLDMVRRLAQSHLLGLFSEVLKTEPALACPPAAPAPPEIRDEDPDLQLQPHDAAGCEPDEQHHPQSGGDAAGEP